MSNAQTIRERMNGQIERELKRCAEAMGPSEWQKHAQWVRDYVVAGAKQWLQMQASKGAL